jgi:hypothetical protein
MEFIGYGNINDLMQAVTDACYLDNPFQGRIVDGVEFLMTFDFLPDGKKQIIQRPETVVRRKISGMDCKSFTVFIASLALKNNLPVIILFTTEDGKNVTHVSPVVAGKHWDVVNKKVNGSFVNPFKVLYMATLAPIYINGVQADTSVQTPASVDVFKKIINLLRA